MTQHQMLITQQLLVCQKGTFSISCDVSCVTIHTYFDSTAKVVGISTVSREQHVIAQTRELVCTKALLPEVISRGIVMSMVV